jgi:hypothetical protein
VIDYLGRVYAPAETNQQLDAVIDVNNKNHSRSKPGSARWNHPKAQLSERDLNLDTMKAFTELSKKEASARPSLQFPETPQLPQAALHHATPDDKDALAIPVRGTLIPTQDH